MRSIKLQHGYMVIMKALAFREGDVGPTPVGYKVFLVPSTPFSSGKV
jgi:hypothetical protein